LSVMIWKNLERKLSKPMACALSFICIPPTPFLGISLMKHQKEKEFFILT